MKELANAIVEVTKEVKGVEKNTTVGTGNASYKGVSDKEVKETIRKAMSKHGLSIVPTSVETDTKVDRWEEDTGRYGVKRKQSVFTEAHTKYLLLHTSGQSIELAGYGHGVDTQDKSAGKATTYALKYTLLYTFLVPTGDIDDADIVHSDDHEAAPGKKPAKESKPDTSATDNAISKLKAAQDVESLRRVWKHLPQGAQKDPEVIAFGKERAEVLAEEVIE